MQPLSTTAKGRYVRSVTITATTSYKQLLEKLKAERLRLSSANNCVPYIVASDKALKMLTLKRPCTIEKFKKCEGATVT